MGQTNVNAGGTGGFGAGMIIGIIVVVLVIVVLVLYFGQGIIFVNNTAPRSMFDMIEMLA